MNKAEKLNQKVMKEYHKHGIVHYNPWLRKVYEQMDKSTRHHNFWKEATNKDGNCDFYQWLFYLVKVLQPMVAVEMGADYGGSAIFILSELPEEGRLYSIDIRDDPFIWQYVPRWDNRITKLVGDDTNLNTYPKDFPWKEVDLWFIDSHHTWEHVQNQMNLIRPHIKDGTVILFHDIYINNEEIANGLKKKYRWDWWEDKRKVFNQGVGVFVI